MRPFKIPEERKGRGEQRDQRREEGGGLSGQGRITQHPLLSAALPAQARRLRHCTLSPAAEGQYFPHLSQTQCTWKKRKRRIIRENFNSLPIKGRVTLSYSSRTQSYHRFFILGKQSSSQAAHCSPANRAHSRFNWVQIDFFTGLDSSSFGRDSLEISVVQRCIFKLLDNNSKANWIYLSLSEARTKLSKSK